MKAREATGEKRASALDFERVTTDVYKIPIKWIVPSGLNHRTIWREIESLADSIQEHKQRDPAKVRPHPTRQGFYELVYGERRLRAHRIIGDRRVASGELTDAGDQTMNAIIANLSDLEVRIEQAIENLDRENPHPMEEALIYQGLMLSREDGGEGMTLSMVADRLHKAKEHITDRLTLLALPEDVRTAYLEERISDGHAVLIARVPDHDAKVRFLADILGQNDAMGQGRVMTVEQARSHAKRFFMLPIARAQFDPTDPTLLDGAPACSSCPYNTASQRLLFRDVETSEAFCTKLSCWNDKADAGWDERAAEARAKGQDVLTDADAKLVWPWPTEQHLAPDSRYKPLDAVTYAVTRASTYGEIVARVEKADKTTVKRTLARTPFSRRIVELITTEEARRLEARFNEIVEDSEEDEDDELDAGPASAPRTSTVRNEDDEEDEGDGQPPTRAASQATASSEPTESAADKFRRLQAENAEKARTKQARFRAALGVIVTAITQKKGAESEPTLVLMRAVAQALARNALVETVREVAQRRGIRPVGVVAKDRGMRAEPEAAILDWIQRSDSATEVFALICEMILTRDVSTVDEYQGVKPVLDALGVSLEDAQAGRAPSPPRLKAKQEPVPTPPAKKPPAPPAKKPAKKAASRAAKKVAKKPAKKTGKKTRKGHERAPVTPALALAGEANVCVVCRCSDDHPCRLPGGRTCSYQSAELCTACGGVMDALVELGQAKPLPHADLVEKVVDACGEELSRDPVITRERVARALMHMLKIGTLQSKAGTVQTVPDPFAEEDHETISTRG